MYTARTGLVLGFHGTDHTIIKEVLHGRQDLKSSMNHYDWLGNGIYFWDNNSARAIEWAGELSRRPESRIKNPAAIGAIIDLGHCFDLLDSKYLSLIKQGYKVLHDSVAGSGKPLPQNRGATRDLLLRELDCSVIEAVHEIRLSNGEAPFDSVRGMFCEGEQVYPTAGFRDKDHIQLCIRNLDCIKGYFLPLERIAV
jgi:hypothetical protein